MTPALATADLLRALTLAGGDLARQHRYAALLGYAYAPLPPSVPTLPELPAIEPPPTPPPEPPATVATLPPRLRARLFGVTELSEPEEEAPADLPEAHVGLSPADCEPRIPGAPIRLAPLVPPNRLWPALKRLILHAVPGGADLPALVRRLAKLQSPHPLPRQTRPALPQRLVVVLDRARHLQPLWPDLALVAAELRRLSNRAGFSGRVVAGHPQAVRELWGAACPWPPPAGSLVLLLSDLGLARHDASAVLSAWSEELGRLRRAGCGIALISPLSTFPVPHLPVHSLAGGRLHKPRHGTADLNQPLTRFKTALAFAARVDAGLPRALRLADPALSPYPELESLYAQDPEVRRSVEPGLESAAAARYRPLLSTWSTAEQCRLLRVLREFHAGEYRSVEMTEILLWSTYASAEARQREAAALDEMHAWFAAFARDRETQPDTPALRAFGESVWGMVCHDTPTQARYSRWLTPLWAQTRERREAPPPAGLWDADLGRMGHEAARPPCWLIQQGDDLLAQSAPPTPGQIALAGPWPTRALSVRQGDRVIHLAHSGHPQRLARLSDGKVELQLDRRHLTLDELVAPWWSLENGRDRQGAYCLAPLIDGRRLRLDLPLRDAAPRVQLRDGAEFRHGRDDYGWYADMALRVKQQTLTQRLRWIPPGEFLMGSPEDEPKRVDSEGPRHRVILTQGYWLADTACTQALWTAVMGSNPSSFKGDPENPVETVSWNDAQDFLKKLGKLAGVKAALPSEAEWEYACRAGTTTPFWWGSRLTSEDANYDGNSPYGGGEKGEYRERTLPVKTFRPNPWGLWQMHGNVWEWCRDGLRTYADAAEVDPEGPPGEGRALRGGSWFFLGGGLRAAYRYRFEPGARDWNFGLRFLLRSPGPGAGTAGV